LVSSNFSSRHNCLSPYFCDREIITSYMMLLIIILRVNVYSDIWYCNILA
jgi:hypothetical protein